MSDHQVLDRTSKSRPLLFVLVSAIGWGLMASSYYTFQLTDAVVPWSEGRLYVLSKKAGEDWSTPDFQHVRVRIRVLPISSSLTKGLLAGVSQARPSAVGLPTLVHAERLIQLPDEEVERLQQALAGGRLPEPGRDEVVAGHEASRKFNLTVDGRELAIVGVLRRDAAVLADSYIARAGEPLAELFADESESAGDGWLVRLAAAELLDDRVRKRLSKAFPESAYHQIASPVHINRGSFFSTYWG